MEVESVQIQENGNRNGSFSFGIIITLNTWFAKYSISKAIKYLVWSVFDKKKSLFFIFCFGIITIIRLNWGDAVENFEFWFV